MNSWQGIYKLHDKLVHLLVIVILSVLVLSFDKLTSVNLSKLNFMESQYLLDTTQASFTVYKKADIDYIISGDSMSLRSKSDYVDCCHCHLTKYDNDHKVTMVATADKVHYDIQAQIAHASGQVTFHVVNSDHAQNIEASTDYMDVNLGSNIASGDTAINIKQEQDNLYGVGFVINLNDQTMTLKSHVKFMQN